MDYCWKKSKPKKLVLSMDRTEAMAFQKLGLKKIEE
jgi:hypothetical protein